MEDGLAEFFARAPAAATAETHFAAQWKAYASDEPLTAALWLINNADPGAFHEAPARIAALKKAAKKYSLEKHSASPDQAKLAALREDIFPACGNVKLPPDANYVREYTQRKQQKLARDAHALQAGALASDHARKVTERETKLADGSVVKAKRQPLQLLWWQLATAAPAPAPAPVARARARARALAAALRWHWPWHSCRKCLLVWTHIRAR